MHKEQSSDCGRASTWQWKASDGIEKESKYLVWPSPKLRWNSAIQKAMNKSENGPVPDVKTIRKSGHKMKNKTG